MFATAMQWWWWCDTDDAFSSLLKGDILHPLSVHMAWLVGTLYKKAYL